MLFDMLADYHLGLFRYIDPEFIFRVDCFAIFVYSGLYDEGITQNLTLLLQKQSIESYSVGFGTLVLDWFELSDIIGDESLYQSLCEMYYFLV